MIQAMDRLVRQVTVRTGAPMLNPIHLKALVTVIRTGSFADAARHLGYTGSAVSQQIASLERAVQVPLFDRAPHSIHPTPAAEFLAGRAHEALAALDALEDDIRAMSDGSLGKLRLGSFPTASQRLLPLGLAIYVQAHPLVDVLLDEGEPKELVALIQDGALDMALVYRYDLVPHAWPSALHATHLLNEELLLLLPRGHRLASTSPIVLEDLRDETWVSTREGTSARSCLERLCASAGFVPRVDYRSNDYDVIRGLVRSGLGIALVPALGHVPDREVVRTHIDGLGVRRNVTMLHRPLKSNGALAGAVQAFQEAVEKLEGDIAGVNRAVMM